MGDWHDFFSADNPYRIGPEIGRGTYAMGTQTAERE